MVHVEPRIVTQIEIVMVIGNDSNNRNNSNKKRKINNSNTNTCNNSHLYLRDPAPLRTLPMRWPTNTRIGMVAHLRLTGWMHRAGGGAGASKQGQNSLSSIVPLK